MNAKRNPIRINSCQMKSKPKLIRWIKRHRRRRHLHCCCCRSSVSTKIHSLANQNARASEMKTKRSRYQLRWAYVNGIEWETQYPWITSSSPSSQTKRNERTIIKKKRIEMEEKRTVYMYRARLQSNSLYFEASFASLSAYWNNFCEILNIAICCACVILW